MEKIIDSSISMTPPSQHAGVEALLAFVIGIFAALLLAVTGILFFLLIPLIGPLIAIFIWVMAVLMPFIWAVKAYNGSANPQPTAKCPYCGIAQRVTAVVETAGQCGQCKNRFVVREGRLEQILGGAR